MKGGYLRGEGLRAQVQDSWLHFDLVLLEATELALHYTCGGGPALTAGDRSRSAIASRC